LETSAMRFTVRQPRSDENSWSLKTVSPSFRVSWNQSRQVTLQKHRGKDPFARTWRSLPFSYAEIITSHECDLIRKSTNWRLRGKTNKEVKGWTHINQSWKEHLFWWYREDSYLFPVQLWKYCRRGRNVNSVHWKERSTISTNVCTSCPTTPKIAA